ncbi:MAG: hypothetical protein RBS37_06625 [Bacteroidales bacterium]|jgi:hypothetical protein|nr:hypothetical protein [Bacteroidales bacterium]
MRYRLLAMVFVFSVLLGSCRRNPYRIDLTGISVNLEIQRLEEDLFRPATLTIRERVPGLIEKYGSFLQLFSYVINTGEVTSPAWHEYLSMFVNDRTNFEAFGAVEKVYSDIGDLERDLREAFRHYRYFFPDRNIPSVYTCMTGFNNSLIVGDSVIGISLERYLGPETEFYGRLGIYKYLTLKMDRPYIVPDCMYAWASTDWDYHEMDYGAENLFARMIHEGKLHYFMRRMLPEADEALLFGFTPGQMQFCRENEGQMWAYLVEHDLLFSTDQLVIKKLTGEAPFTSYFSNESPGKAAVWIGFRVVDQYMKRNPGVSLRQLMETRDYQLILSGARYNP